MQHVRTTNTPIEVTVRDVLLQMGVTAVLNCDDLPGKPDIVLPEHTTVILVHGCFWHGHEICDKGTRRPKHNAAFWEAKIEYNVAKDRRVVQRLEALGWRVIVIWECEINNRSELKDRLQRELVSHA